MRGVTQQGDAVRPPGLQRVAEVDPGDQRLVHQGEQILHRRARVRQGRVQVGQVTGGRPGLAVHLGGGHERAQAVDAVRVPVVPERIKQHVAARSEPGHDLRVVAAGHLLPRDQPAPDDDAGEPGLPLAHQLLPGRRSHPVRADEQVTAYFLASGKLDAHVAGGLLEGDDAAAGPHALGRQRHQQARHEVGAVPAVVGLAVFRRPRLKRRRGDDLVVAEGALLGDVDAGRVLSPVSVGPEVCKRFHRVRVEPEARSDRGKRRRLFQHQRLEAGLAAGRSPRPARRCRRRR